MPCIVSQNVERNTTIPQADDFNCLMKNRLSTLNRLNGSLRRRDALFLAQRLCSCKSNLLVKLCELKDKQLEAEDHLPAETQRTSHGEKNM